MQRVPSKSKALFSWCADKLRHAANRLLPDTTDTDDSNRSSTATAAAAAVECYACTQAGLPAFHSTSCDRAHSPEWEACAGSSLIPIQPKYFHNNSVDDVDDGSAHDKAGSNKRQRRVRRRRRSRWVMDPRSPRVLRWNRGLLLARAVALALDPLFFYALSVGGGGGSPPCMYMDGGLAAAVAVLRTAADMAHLVHIWLQLRLAYVSRESLVVGCGKLVWDARMVAEHYLRSVKGFWFDLFVILPVPQVAFWMVVPKLIKEEEIKLIMTILLMIFLFQFLPKVYHIICVMRRMQKVTGFIFGSIWWGFGLNLIAYFTASHAAGGCWYVLTIQRIASCIKQQCEKDSGCSFLSFSCSKEVCYHLPLSSSSSSLSCASYNLTTAPIGVQNNPICLKVNGPFPYGIYSTALPVVSSSSLAVKILYPIFWGLMTLSTFGNNLEPTSHWLEVIFSITIVLSGLMLFTLLIGNIQVFLHAVMARKRKMQLRCRDMEWWMRRRQLPSQLRQRVREYDRERWAATRGEDEMEMVRDLPEGLRRDIKRFLCIDLIKQVPFFHNLDDLIMDNICERVESLVFSKNEKVIREGDPVQRMVFIVKGGLQSSQQLSRGMVATCMLGPGGFFGDELLSWCLRRPFVDRLPASSATFVCTEPTEAFGLGASQLRYITEHFRYKFANEKLKRTARFYSANWRTWAAVNIQLAWRRYKTRSGRIGTTIEPSEEGGDDRRLRRYAAMFMSLRPHDHLE